MRIFFLGVLSLTLSSIAPAQLQLAPNPACNGAPYCRDFTSPSSNPVKVMGYHNGLLYGWQYVSNGYQFYSSSTFAPEGWQTLGTFVTTPGSQDPVEIIFGPGACSTHKYIYTRGHSVLRVESDWSNPTSLPIPDLPNRPTNTTGRVASFAAVDQGTQTRLFYGNYPSPNDMYTLATCQASYYAPAQCPHAYIWHSDDCGDNWSSPYAFGEPAYHAQEVHAINIDPGNPLNVYVTIDAENANIETGGLWKSTDGGLTFTHVSAPNNSSLDITPINFVFPAGSNQIFLESDGDSSLNVMPNGMPGGPLVSWDKVNGDPFQVAAPWPTVPSGTPLWAGVDGGIGLTSEQNIFLYSAAGGRNSSQRQGVWYFAPPHYNTPTPIGEFAPLINHVSASNGIATAMTLTPHGLVSTSVVTITGVSVPAFNSSVDAHLNPIPVTGFTITGPSTFNYDCSGCPNNQEGTGGYATDIGLDIIGRTVEVTDPATNATFLYNGNTRFVKPEFTGAHQTLSTMDVGGGYYETFFVGTDEHVHMLLNNTNTGAWGNHDLNTYAQTPTNIPPAIGSTLSSLNANGVYAETFFIGTDQHVHMIMNNLSAGGWGNHDLNAYAQTPTNVSPAPGSALSSLIEGGTYAETFFIGTDQHVHMIMNNLSVGGWGNHDVTAYASGSSSIVPVVGSALSSVYLSSGNVEVFFVGSDQHVHLLISSNGSWANYDLNSLAASSSSVAPAVWTQLAALDLGNGSSEVFFIGTDLHVHRLLGASGVWTNDDVNALAQTPTNIFSMLASPMEAFNLPNGATATFFIGTDHHAHQLYYNGNGAWGNYDINSYAQAPTNILPADRSPFATINFGNGSSETFFLGNDGINQSHVHMLYNNAAQGAWGNHDINSYAQAPTNINPAVP